MKKAIVRLLMAAAILAAGSLNHASAQDTRFNVTRFQVEGNSILPAQRVEQLVAPFVGSGKVYGDIQQALEALEGEYRRLGFGTVQVYVPEQELTTGVVRLLVTEGVVGNVTITGNKYFDEANVRASLPDLKEGTAPNMRKLSENVQLSNENPAKQVEVTLGVGEEENQVDIKVDVREENPERFYVTLDNTGTKASGKHRVGVSYQNANLGNSDQVLTLAYTTAVDAPGGVKVDIYSIGYRLPLYAIGDSIDVIYGNSSTNTPASVLAPGGTLALNGKGSVFGLRYNHIFPRVGEYTSKLVLGFDYKYIDSRCATAGAPFGLGTVGSCTPYTLRPITGTYSGQWLKPGESIDFSVGFTHNLFPMGSSYNFTTGPGGNDRYSLVTGRQTSETFTAIRLGGSYSSAISGDWIGRAAINGQYAHNALPSGEQVGLTGSTAVRGFLERAVSADRGYVANLEIYSPDYAAKLGLSGSLKGIAFYDWASGHNFVALATGFARTNVASAGIGFRYSLKKDISVRFDVARVLEGHQPTPGAAEAAKPGDIRGHFGLAFGF